MGEMLVATTDTVPGYKIVKTLGMASGGCVLAKWFGSDMMAGFKDMFGGKIKRYVELMDKARDDAINVMSEKASKMGANAIVGVRLVSPEIGAGGKAELLAYGTAVVVKKE
jgi:uncharacterized protein YbjQ (UPF0145 family)